MLKPLSKVIFTCAVFLGVTACTSSHLDIFPPLSSPELAEKKFTVEQLREDVDAFVEGMAFRHVQYHGYANVAELNTQSMAVKASITRPMTRVEFYRAVGKLSYLFNDGHSFLIWPYQEFESLKSSGNQPFPFAIEINNEGTFFARGYQLAQSSEALPRGTQLLSVNGVPINQLVDTAQMYVGGETRILRDHVVASRFSQMLWSVFGYINDFSLTVSVDGQQQKVMINKGQTWKLISEDNSFVNQDFFFKVLHTPELNRKVGYLSLATFDVDPDWFENFIDDTFSKINQQGIDKLIIDIRENGGGNTDAPQYLTQYLASEPFRMVSELKERLNNENRGWFNYKGDVGETLTKEWSDWHSPKSQQVRFNGDTYLLISPISYSAAIVFATTLKDFGFATLVGQETGGFANQTAQGNLFNLPHSELRAYVPTRLLLRPNGDSKVTGVVPQITTENSSADLLLGIDTEIKAVLDRVDGHGH